MSKTPKSQVQASHRWTNNHKKQQQYYQKKSYAKNFILKNASVKDIKQVQQWCLIRLNQLK